MNTCRRHRFLCLACVSLLAVACATASQPKPVEKLDPQMHAQRIYEALIAREGRRLPQRDPRTLAGFPEAPIEVARQLEALAASKQGDEREALLELSRALRGTGKYSRVLFRSKTNDIIVKYRAIARKDDQTAHAGWNSLPIGFYYVWAERSGKVVSEVNEYEMIKRSVVIDLVIS